MSGHSPSASQQENMSEECQSFWLQWVEAAFPDLDSRAFFLPPVHFNRVPMRKQPIAAQDVLVLYEAPGKAGQSTPGQGGQLTPGQAGQSTPGQGGQLTPGQAGQSTPGRFGQSTPGQSGQSTPRQPGQSTPGQPGQSTPGQSTLGQSGQSTPGQSGQSTPGQSTRGQSTPRQSGQSTPGQSGQSTSGQPGQSTPGLSGQSTSGQSGQSTPGQSGQSTPGQSGQSTPGQSGQSTPGQSGQSTPEQFGQPTPGQPGQSTPGQSGQSTPGQSSQLIPAQPVHSKKATITSDQCIDPQSNTVQNVLDVGPAPKKAEKIRCIADKLNNVFKSARSQKARQKCCRAQETQQKSYIQDSDVRDDDALQRILFCLQKMSEINREVLVGLTQLQFGQYLGEPCYAAAAAQLPVPANLPSVHPQNWKQGDFDVLLIHRHYGLVVCEVKAFGDNVQKLKMSQQDIDKNIRKKLKQAVSQLDKAEAMLSHLVSDVTPGLRITKTIAVPNLKARQVQQAVSGDPLLTQELCRCLRTADPTDITALCLCSDQLSDPRTPWDVTSDVLQELGSWWQRRVAESWPDSHMTCDVYKTLVARFCGPATAVTVPCTSFPRLCVKTLGQAVSWTGHCYTAQIVLFPEQVDLLNTAPPRLFVAGPPGTGKTVVLLLMAIEWLRCGNDVYIVSTWWKSQAACNMLYYLLRHTVNKQLTSVVSQPHLIEYDFKRRIDVEIALNELSEAGRTGSLHVIADEAMQSDNFQTFCDKLLTQVSDLHLWAACCYHGYAPVNWQVEYLTRPLRSPPAVVREVQQDVAISMRYAVKAYSERGVPDHTDGPPVRQIYHRGRRHSGRWPVDCVTCGREVASFLHSLRDPGNNTSTTITNTSASTTPPCLQWRDVLVLVWFKDISLPSGVVSGLRGSGIPVRVMKDHDTEDVATASENVVWVAHGDRVRGLERKVVVCLDNLDVYLESARLLYTSRCTSQLVIVSSDH